MDITIDKNTAKLAMNDWRTWNTHIVFIVMFHGRNGVWNHRQLDGVFNNIFRLTTMKISKLRLSSSRKIYRCSVVSPYKGQVMLKAFPRHVIIMVAAILCKATTTTAKTVLSYGDLVPCTWIIFVECWQGDGENKPRLHTWPIRSVMILNSRCLIGFEW